MQVIIMTSDKYHKCLNPFLYLWFKHTRGQPDGEKFKLVICGFSEDAEIRGIQATAARTASPVSFFSIGKSRDFPRRRWSDALRMVLNKVADETFILMLEDYWVLRDVDVRGVRILYDYARQFENVLKIDLATDRLFADGGGRYLYGNNTYNDVGHIDLIRSPQGSDYQLSLWGGIWNRDVMKRFIVPAETAQQIELNGTRRVNEHDDILVLGTRQSPIKHGNIYISRNNGEPTYDEGTWKVDPADLEYFRLKGWLE